MSELFYLIVGAILAIIGGVANDEIRAGRERARELKAIKISLCDELGEIVTTVKNMHEVWEKSKILYPSYISDLASNTTAFDSLRQRLFLISDDALRTQIVAFYKKLKDTAKKSRGKVGTLAQTAEALAEQTGIESDFKTLGAEAKLIQDSLKPKVKS